MSPLTQLITNSTHIAVISHVHPDGDAVGSAMGLSLGLRELGKEVSTVLIDPVPEVFSFLPHLDCITSTLPTADLYLVVDVSDMFRTGFPELLTLPNVVVIDHHPKGDLYRNAEATVQDYATDHFIW